MRAQDFLDYVRETKSKNTYKEYKFGLTKFCEWFVKSPDEILEMRKKDVISDDPMQKRRFTREIEKFHAFLLRQGYKINSARVLCLGIMQLFRFFEMPVKIERQSKVTRTVVTTRDFPLSPNHLKRMYAVADLRERAIISLAKDLGWRIGDFIKIRRDELPDLNQEPPILFEKITQKEDVLAKSFLSGEMVELLKVYLPTLAPENPYLFQSNHGKNLDQDSVNRIVKDLVKKAGISVPKNKRVRFHAFRKLFLSTCANLSVDPNMAKLMVGKSVDKSMLTYLNGVEYRKAFEKISKALAVTEPVEKAKDETVEELENTVEFLKREVSAHKQAWEIGERKREEEMMALEQKYLEQFETLQKRYLELKNAYEQIQDQPEPEWMKEFRKGMKELRQYARADKMKEKMRDLGRQVGKQMRKER